MRLNSIHISQPTFAKWPQPNGPRTHDSLPATSNNTARDVTVEIEDYQVVPYKPTVTVEKKISQQQQPLYQALPEMNRPSPSGVAHLYAKYARVVSEENGNRIDIRI